MQLQRLAADGEEAHDGDGAEHLAEGTEQDGVAATTAWLKAPAAAAAHHVAEDHVEALQGAPEAHAPSASGHGAPAGRAPRPAGSAPGRCSRL